MSSRKVINKVFRINEDINSYTIFVTFFGTRFLEKPSTHSRDMCM